MRNFREALLQSQPTTIKSMLDDFLFRIRQLQHRRPDAPANLTKEFLPVLAESLRLVGWLGIDHRFADRCLRQMESSNLRLAWLGAANTDTKEGIAEEIRIGPYRDVGPFRLHVLNLDAINNAPSRLRGVRMDGILGADFLITHGALIDYSSSALRFHPSVNVWMEPPRLAAPYRTMGSVVVSS